MRYRKIYKNTPSFIADQAITSRGDIMPHGRRAYSSLKRQFGYMSKQRIATCTYIVSCKMGGENYTALMYYDFLVLYTTLLNAEGGKALTFNFSPLVRFCFFNLGGLTK